MNKSVNSSGSLSSLLVSLLAILAASFVAYHLLSIYPIIEPEKSSASNLGFFLLINLNIIVVMVLVFLVIKNLVKLVLDRRRNILGARLRSRLVIAFVGLSLIPSVLLFFVARGILDRVLQGWFSPQVEAAVDGALSVARFQYDTAEASLYRNIRFLSQNMSDVLPIIAPLQGANTDSLRKTNVLTSYFDKKREEYGLFSLSLVLADGTEVVSTSSLEAKHGIVVVPATNRAAFRQALSGAVVVRPEQSPNAEFLRAYAPVDLSTSFFQTGFPETIFSTLGATDTNEARFGISRPSKGPSGSVACLVATYWVLPELNNALTKVLNSYDDYKELRSYRRPLVSSYFLTLIVVTLLIVFGAIWVGFYLARGLTIPLGLLAEGTEQIAHGNLDHRIPEIGDDELSVLVRSFNMMTSDLKETTEELVQRRRYMETVLTRVGVGVVSVDTSCSITTVNITAAEILHLEGDLEGFVSKLIGEVIPQPLCSRIELELEQLFASGEDLVSLNLSAEIRGSAKYLQLTITKLVNEQGEVLGAVLLLDDITELVSAQRMAAWREVARRIAHEIKNPLTPIKLNAERIKRRCASAETLGSDTSAAREMISESTDLIVRQVENLRTLVNEFSSFARMPRAQFRSGNLNLIIETTLTMFEKAHPEIAFQLDLDSDLPNCDIDIEQIERVLINLVKNSIASVKAFWDKEVEVEAERSADTAREAGTEDSDSTGAGPKIKISSRHQSEFGKAIISVEDNGQGIADADKEKLFEPYFTTKHGGTGLGLSIVRTIIADHSGYIRVTDVSPRGACFRAEIPLQQNTILAKGRV